MATAQILVFSVEPTANLAVQPTVRAYDGTNTTDTTYTETVTVDVTPGVENYSARLWGTITIPMVAGVGTFTGLTLPANGTYTLTATSGTLTSAVSTAFVMSTQVERTALSAIRKIVRYRLGFLTDGTNEPADYAIIYPTAIEEARDFCVMELAVAENPVTRETVEIPAVANQREYDFTRQGFLKIDAVDYGSTSTMRVRLIPFEEAPALYLMGNQAVISGNPAYFYLSSPGVIGLVPSPSTTGKSLYLTGSRICADMASDSDTTHLAEMFNKVIALKAAIDICSTWDMEQPEHQQRVGGLRTDFDAVMRQVKRLVYSFAPRRGGFMVAQSASERMLRQRRGSR